MYRELHTKTEDQLLQQLLWFSSLCDLLQGKAYYRYEGMPMPTHANMLFNSWLNCTDSFTCSNTGGPQIAVRSTQTRCEVPSFSTMFIIIIETCYL